MHFDEVVGWQLLYMSPVMITRTKEKVLKFMDRIDHRVETPGSRVAKLDNWVYIVESCGACCWCLGGGASQHQSPSLTSHGTTPSMDPYSQGSVVT